MNAPVLLSPDADTPVQNAETVLRWQPVEGAAGYRVQVAADPTFETLVVDQRLGPLTSLRVRRLAAGDEGRLYWRVGAKGGPFAEASFPVETPRRRAAASDDRSSRTALGLGVLGALVLGALAFALVPTHSEFVVEQARRDSIAADSVRAAEAGGAAAAPATTTAADSTALPAAAAAPAAPDSAASAARSDAAEAAPATDTTGA